MSSGARQSGPRCRYCTQLEQAAAHGLRKQRLKWRHEPSFRRYTKKNAVSESTREARSATVAATAAEKDRERENLSIYGRRKGKERVEGGEKPSTGAVAPVGN